MPPPPFHRKIRGLLEKGGLFKGPGLDRELTVLVQFQPRKIVQQIIDISTVTRMYTSFLTYLMDTVKAE